MLYYLHLLTEYWSPFRVLQYISFRSLAGAATAFIISMIFGPKIIRWLKYMEFGQQVRKDEVPSLITFHGKKQGTPTMGGILIIVSVVLSTLLWSNPLNGYIQLALATMCFMGAVGFWDDFLKIKRKQSKGLGARQKLLLQLVWVIVVVAALLNWSTSSEKIQQLMVPFFKEPLVMHMSLIGILLFVSLVIVGSTNAVNLTDGLDGLAVGCCSSTSMAYLVMSYVAGHKIFAEYLLVPYVPGSGELTILCGCLLGATLGFLWFNCHPAKVFMGDTGSLALGGVIAIIAIMIKQELALIFVGGVFVIEAVSVLIQVSVFKLTGGKRVFKCSPIHHHFEVLEKERAEREGRDIEVVETMITIRFWILSIIFAVLGVATLKIR